MATTTSSQLSDTLIGEACHFLAIPAEVRLQIYLLLLLFPFPMDLGFRGCYTDLGFQMQHAQLTEYAAPILFSCKTIRSEALPVFYTKNLFSICAPTDLTEFLASAYATRMKLSRSDTLLSTPVEHGEIMDGMRAEDMKCFVELQRLTVVRTRLYPGTIRGFVKRPVREVMNGMISKALKATLTERPHIICRLILDTDCYGASHPIKKYQVPEMELVFFKIHLQDGNIVLSLQIGKSRRRTEKLLSIPA